MEATKLEMVKFIERISYVDMFETSECYYSTLDGSYLTHVGMDDIFEMLLKNGITDHVQSHNIGGNTASLGFNPKKKKWYGWSHRAIYGFGVGYITKKGDCGFTADNPEEMIEDYAYFFSDISEECAEEHRKRCTILKDRSGIFIWNTPLKIPTAPMNEIDNLIENPEDYPLVDIYEGSDGYEKKCGKGKWTAKNLMDAKQMAIDFAESVS